MLLRLGEVWLHVSLAVGPAEVLRVLGHLPRETYVHVKFRTCGQGVTDPHEHQPWTQLTIPIEKVGMRGWGPSLAV